MEISVGSGISIGKPDSPCNIPIAPPPFPKILEIEINWNKNKSVHGACTLGTGVHLSEIPQCRPDTVVANLFLAYESLLVNISFSSKIVPEKKLASLLLYIIDRFVPEAKGQQQFIINTVEMNINC